MKLTKKISLGLGGVFALALGANNAFAAAYIEVGDADDLPVAGAGQVVDTMPGEVLDSISGGIDGVDDIADGFVIRITDPGDFTASTNSDFGTGGSASFDTRLFLFGTDGSALLGNDDDPGPNPGFFSTITDVSIWGGDTSADPALLTPGDYLLVVSGWPAVPGDGAQFAFDMAFSPVAPNPASALVGPNPLFTGATEWVVDAGADIDSGAYTIGLTGASFIPIPEPGSAALLGLGALGFFLRRRR